MDHDGRSLTLGSVSKKDTPEKWAYSPHRMHSNGMECLILLPGYSAANVPYQLSHLQAAICFPHKTLMACWSLEYFVIS